MNLNQQIAVHVSVASPVAFSGAPKASPLLQELMLENLCEEDLLDLTLCVEIEPLVAGGFTQSIGRLPAGRTLEIPTQETALLPDPFLGETAPFQGTVRIRITDSKGEALEERSFTGIPYEYLPGDRLHQEDLVSFILPSAEVLAPLLAQAKGSVRVSGSKDAENLEFPSPEERMNLAAALYAALAQEGIRLVPRAPEQDFGRIRPVDEVLRDHRATDREMALTYASLLEAAGLRPLIVHAQETTLCGVWLTEDSFSTSRVSDVAALTKRSAAGLQQLLVVDPSFSTLMRTFTQAMTHAAQRLQSGAFEGAIDVAKARWMGYLPLPKRRWTGTHWELVDEVKPQEDGQIPQLISLAQAPMEGTTGLPKQKIWERKLLDLSLRNSLLNYKRERNAMALLHSPNAPILRSLDEGAAFSILPRPTDWEGLKTPEGADFRQGDSFRRWAAEEFKNGRLLADLSAQVLEERGQKLVKSARTSLEETGSCALYLAFGLLRWYAKDDGETPHYAPLVLLPVDLEAGARFQGFRLKGREEDPQFNTTLFEGLKKEFGIVLQGVDPLPEDANGVDLSAVFAKVRQGVLLQPGWDVLEEVHLGLFSFAKFMMWADLSENLEIFRQNPLVESLVQGQLTQEFPKVSKTARFLEEEAGEQELIYPLSADASQSLAVLAAARGASFVLHGPPGTGKSQTITNIIANALMQDKRVLFVAQKMAALEVVQKRLKDLGIGSFCLELHAKGASRRRVLDQLEESMRITKVPRKKEAPKTLAALQELKEELNEEIRALYDADESGYSLYDLIVEEALTKDFPRSVEPSSAVAFTDLKKKEDLLKNLTDLGAYAGGPYRNPLRGIGPAIYQPDLKERIASLVEEPLLRMEKALIPLVQKAPSLEPKCLAEVLALPKLQEYSQALYALFPNMHFVAGGMAHWPQALTQAKDLMDDAVALEGSLLANYPRALLSVDSRRVRRDLDAWESKTALSKLFQKNPVEREFQTLLSGEKLTAPEILDLMSRLEQFKEAQERARSARMRLSGAFGAEILSAKAHEMAEAADLLTKLLTVAPSEEALEELDEALQDDSNADLRASLEQLRVLGDGYGTALRAWLKDTAFEERELEGQGPILEAFLERLQEIKGHLSSLKDWLAYQKARAEVLGQGLSDFADAYDQGEVSETQMSVLFRKSVTKGLLRQRLAAHPTLASSTGGQSEQKAARLKELAEQAQRIHRLELYVHLAQKVPNLVMEEDTSKELGVLQRALRSGGRALSIRSLFEKTDHLLRRIAPCMMMSPQSVAQYLSPQADLFDLVIFDEASQMPTAEAVGALGRAKQAIIVGDPKQLPPTSFFAAQSGEEMEERADLDSILEDALALSLPNGSLLWHYRSRHESLIAYSNRAFYNGELYTYPSPDDRVSRVHYVASGGVYERGRDRVNREEARALVEEVVRRLGEADNPPTMGIVTFSVVQQALIERILQETLAKDEALRQKLLDLPEPLFIKNLENVQGDERDIILFSVGYGPDENGQLFMNFGPLNQEGGWRRLNVAVSRARQEMWVFTSINPDEFAVPPGAPRGVLALKEFLNYAKSFGRRTTLQKVQEESSQLQISSLLADRLRAKGYQVETQVGTSEFRVDLALLDQKDPTRFALGVQCGGESFQKSGSALDREVLSPSVLRGLGWRLERVHPMDFLDDEEAVVARIHNRMKEEETPSLGATFGEGDAKAAGPHPYTLAHVENRNFSVNDFLQVSSAAVIGPDLMKIIEEEGPISLRLLTRRLLRAYGLEKAHAPMQEHVERILNKFRPHTTLGLAGPIYWSQTLRPENVKGFRPTLPEDAERTLADFAAEELYAALFYVLEQPLRERALTSAWSKSLEDRPLTVEKEKILEGVFQQALLQGTVVRDASGRVTRGSR
ncbi:DNA helicase related protein [Clostridiaceae bacterium JG1575]|nr:DNA helicase related protein [Clostridiaceae bacterium JG1575]